MSKKMTVGQLAKRLAKLVESGKSRMPVCINKATFSHPLEEDGCVILNVHDADVQWTTIMDGDGFTELRKDVGERGQTNFVLIGNSP